jgi:hypothetical protein
MRLQSAFAAAVVAAGLALIGTAASAAPMSVPALTQHSDAETLKLTEKVTYGYGYRYGHRRHHRGYGYRYYSPPAVFGFYGGPRYRHYRGW